MACYHGGWPSSATATVEQDTLIKNLVNYNNIRRCLSAACLFDSSAGFVSAPLFMRPGDIVSEYYFFYEISPCHQQIVSVIFSAEVRVTFFVLHAGHAFVLQRR